MLILDDSSKLGDGFLAGKESLQSLKERNQAGLKRFMLADQDELADATARLGKPMQHSELIKKVVGLTNGKLHAEASIAWPGGYNFYMFVNGEKVCLGAPFEQGWMPEYTVVHENERHVVDSRTVGWREVLMRLMKKRILTEKQVFKAFGTPTPTPSDRWQKQSKRLRG